MAIAWSLNSPEELQRCCDPLLCTSSAFNPGGGGELNCLGRESLESTGQDTSMAAFMVSREPFARWPRIQAQQVVSLEPVSYTHLTLPTMAVV